MFEVKYCYNPIIKQNQNGELFIVIYKSNGRKNKIDYIFYDKDYKKLMNSVNNYISFVNNSLEKSFFNKLKEFISLYN